MPEDQFFRSEMYRRQEESLYGRVSFSNGLSGGTLLAISLVSVLIMFVIVGIAAYPTTYQATGVLRLQSGIDLATAEHTGKVADVRVKNGQQVVAGQRLAFVSTDEMFENGKLKGPETNASLGRQDDNLVSQINAERSQFYSRQSAIQAQIGGVRSRLLSYASREKVLKELLVRAQSDLENAKAIAERGYVSKKNLADREISVFEQSERLELLQNERGADVSLLSQLRAELAVSKDRRDSNIEALLVSREEISRIKQNSDLDRGYSIAASKSGIVYNLSATVGDRVKAGDVLLSIANPDAPLTAEIALDEKMAGKLKVGDQARISVRAFPSSEHGFLVGKFLYISEVPIERKGIDMPVYLATLSVEEPSSTNFGEKIRLLPGMKLDVVVPLEDTLLFWRIFDASKWFKAQ